MGLQRLSSCSRLLFWKWVTRDCLPYTQQNPSVTYQTHVCQFVMTSPSLINTSYSARPNVWLQLTLAKLGQTTADDMMARFQA